MKKDVAVGIIRREKRVLVCRRKKGGRYPLKWEFPGGKLESGESPQQALRRELQEELNIDAVVGPEYFRQEWDYSEGHANPSDGSAFRIFYYMVSSHRGTLSNRAFEEVRWVFPEELARMDILEGNREAVALLIGDAKQDEG